MDAYAYACLDCRAVDWHPFAGQAIGSVNAVTVVPVVMLTVVLVVMDSIVGFDSVVEIEQTASVAVALKSIAVLAVPLHLAGCVAFDSCLNFVAQNEKRKDNKQTNKLSKNPKFQFIFS